LFIQQNITDDIEEFIQIAINLIQIASSELPSFFRKAASDFAYAIGGNIYHKRLCTAGEKQFPSSFV